MSMKNKNRIIEVVPYDPQWKKDYEEETRRIRDVLGQNMVKVYHVGSTAIPGMAAKPIIDILVEVGNLEAVDCCNEAMKAIGYIAKGENGIVGRRYFLKGQEALRTHHLHTFQTGNREIARHLSFRDYMMAHPEEAQRYEGLKMELAERFRHNVGGYVEGKDSYIKEIDKRALEWAGARKAFCRTISPELNTQRFILRQYRNTDFVQYAEPFYQKEVMEAVGGKAFETEEQVYRLLKKLDYEKENFLKYGYVIASKQDNRILGEIGIKLKSIDHGIVELGYLLKKQYWGQNVMTECVKALINEIHRVGPNLKIQGDCRSENVGSRRVMEKCGLTFIGMKEIANHPYKCFERSKSSL